MSAPNSKKNLKVALEYFAIESNCLILKENHDLFVCNIYFGFMEVA